MSNLLHSELHFDVLSFCGRREQDAIGSLRDSTLLCRPKPTPNGLAKAPSICWKNDFALLAAIGPGLRQFSMVSGRECVSMTL
jgi:hypothetical protein